MNSTPLERQQKVLIVDDELLNRKLLADILRDDYRVILAKNGSQAIEMVNKHQPDLILLDIIMPGENGYQVLVTLKSNPQTQDIPVVFISALDTDRDEEKGLVLGATDYISKPFRKSLVKARIDNHMRMVSQRKLLEELANLDGLTNVDNRRCLEQNLDEEWRRAQRNQQPLSLAMLDVDHFKQFNDHYGHGGGDKVLRQVARAMRAQIKRPGDRVARYGGEEFVILLPETTHQDAERIMDKLRQAIVDLKIPHDYSEAGPYLSVSIGGATLMPNEHEEPITLLNKADVSLYRAKNLGRNRVIWNQ
ncbi:diguanylate cyclase domain-containing protein [Nitrincola alkalilacustris]|uniref:GGDEF domain-containing response regulator n=1 Tax=Nitrincola alkalilacustris TaxID=1571224 RepID=UPI00124D43C5|nr:diguanylate cyclase [Nitrincola alkalilacustris]